MEYRGGRHVASRRPGSSHPATAHWHGCTYRRRPHGFPALTRGRSTWQARSICPDRDPPGSEYSYAISVGANSRGVPCVHRLDDRRRPGMATSLAWHAACTIRPCFHRRNITRAADSPLSATGALSKDPHALRFTTAGANEEGPATCCVGRAFQSGTSLGTSDPRLFPGDDNVLHGM